MTALKDEPYIIENRQIITETSNLRVQILTLADHQEVPWHYHTEVTDTFFCLEGPMIVETKTADGDHELQIEDTCSVPPKTAHRVTGKNGGRCRFLIVQGVGEYDFNPVKD